MANGYYPLPAFNTGPGLNFEPVYNALSDLSTNRFRQQQMDQQSQNALMDQRRWQAQDARAEAELGLRRQQFAAEQANLPFERQYKQAQIDNVRADIAARQQDTAAKAKALAQQEAFYQQFAEPAPPAAQPSSGMPQPSKLGGPVPEHGGVSRFSSVGQMPTYDMADGETGGAQVSSRQAQPSAAPPAAMTARDLFNSLSPEDQATGRLMLQSGDRDGFFKLLQSGSTDANRIRHLTQFGIDPASAEGQVYRASGKLPAAAYERLSNNARKQQQNVNIAAGLENLLKSTTDYDDASFSNALGPIQGSEPGWMGTPLALLARAGGEMLNRYERGNATPNEVRNSISGSTEALAAAIKPLIRAPGEGVWTDADQARLVAIVGDLAQSSSKEEFKRRLNGVRDRIQTNFGLSVSFDAFGGQAGAAAPSGYSIRRLP